MPYISAPTGPVTPDSIQGVYRSTMAMLESIKTTESGSVSSLLLVFVWVSFIYHWVVVGTVYATCVSIDFLDNPVPYIVSFFTPSSMYSLVVLSLLLVIISHTLETYIGWRQFAAVVFGNTLAISIICVVYFPNLLCFPATESLGPALASLTALLHGQNIRVFTEGLDASVRVPFPVEPRWFCWFLLLLFTMTADIDTLYVYAIAVCVGGLPFVFRVGRHVISLPKRALVDFAVLFASIYVLPFTVLALQHLPFNGPSIFAHRNFIIRDHVSLLAIHFLLASPFLFIANKRIRMWLLIPILCAWIYGTQTSTFSVPGPGFVGLAYSAYRIIAQ